MHIEWKIVPSCCRMLIGLETSTTVAAVLEPQKTFGGLDILVFGSVLVMTDDSYAKKFMCSLLASERVCRISSPPKPPKYVLERTMRHHMSLHKSSQYYVRHKNRSCKYMEDMYCDSDYNNVILFTVINTFYTCQADVETKMTVGKYLCMTQRMEKCAQSELIHVSLVKKPHIVWVWSGSASTRRSLEMNRSVRRKRSDCVKEMQNNIYYNTDFSGWWLTKLLSCGCVLIRDRVNVW